MRITKAHTVLITSTLLLATLAGCSGQGNYTRQGVSLAKERMSFLKSATEWELARQAFLAGDLEKAMRKVDYSLSINDTVVKSHVLKGRIQIEMGDLGNALKSLNTAATLDPEESDAHYYLAVVYERINEPELAYTHFENACEFDDYNPAYAVAAAETLIDLNRIEEAKIYLGTIPMAQNNAGIRQALGHIALLEHDHETAVKMFNNARLLAPDDEGIMEDLIHAQMLAGEFGAAESNISLLLKKSANTDRRDLKVLHAKSLFNTGRPVEARTIYQELLSTSEGKSDIDSWIGLANASFVIEDMRTVRKAASRVVAISPSSHEGYLLYAMYYRQAEDHKSSLDAINKALANSPMDAGIYAFRAVILNNLDQHLQAFASIAQAVKLEPANLRYSQMLDQLSNGSFAAVQTE
ncbi:MAG: tetratricopeptide repeat protein [Phycisphaerales bacterium]|nr:tetratricopeptide repeat protein [Phycisphaerales bacterium]